MLTFILECGFYFYGIVHVLMLKQVRQAKYTPTPKHPSPPHRAAFSVSWTPSGCAALAAHGHSRPNTVRAVGKKTLTS